MKRIVIVGTTGSGKTTLAERLAERMGLLCIDLDVLNWRPNWQMAPQDEFVEQVTTAVAHDSWVVSGNYSRVRHLIWLRADTLVWLDYPWHIVLGRLFRRTIRRIRTQEDLWGTGNRESWHKQFFSRDSLFIWFLRTYHRRRREYPILLQQPDYAHLVVYRFASPLDAESWVQNVPRLDHLSAEPHTRRTKP
jgi:adenylate kinase family enzyme